MLRKEIYNSVDQKKKNNPKTINIWTMSYKTRGSQEPVIAHLADSCQIKEHIKTIRSNILPKFGSNWVSNSQRTEYFNGSPIGWFVKLSLDVAAILVGWWGSYACPKPGTCNPVVVVVFLLLNVNCYLFLNFSID